MGHFRTVLSGDTFSNIAWEHFRGNLSLTPVHSPRLRRGAKERHHSLYLLEPALFAIRVPFANFQHLSIILHQTLHRASWNNRNLTTAIKAYVRLLDMKQPIHILYISLYIIYHLYLYLFLNFYIPLNRYLSTVSLLSLPSLSLYLYVE